MKLLLARQNAGLGDWIMLTACMKMINDQRPDVNISLLASPHIGDRLLTLPLLCGVKYELTSNSLAADYDVVCPHAVYDIRKVMKTSDHLCKDMLHHIRDNGIEGLTYEPDVRVRPLTAYGQAARSRPYVVMPSVGKDHAEQFGGNSKNWPYLRELAGLLHHYYDIVQVGNHGDPSLPYSVQYYEPSFTVLSHIYEGAEFAVSLENGLSHWAGHHNKRSYTIYTGKHWCTPAHAWYPTQIPVHAKDFAVLDADTVYRVIRAREHSKANTPVAVL